MRCAFQLFIDTKSQVLFTSRWFFTIGHLKPCAETSRHFFEICEKAGAPGLSPFQPLDIIGSWTSTSWALLPCYPATGVNAVGQRVLWAHKLRFGESAISVWKWKIMLKKTEVKNCSDASSYIMKGMILSHCILRLGLGALQET